MKICKKMISLVLCTAMVLSILPVRAWAENNGDIQQGSPALTPDEVVIDYGLDVLVDVTANDPADAVPVGLLAEAPDPGSFDISSAAATLDIMDGGRKVATATLEGSSIRFRLDRDNGMRLSKAYTFYYVSRVRDSGGDASYRYTHVRVIPASTMYFEEDFVSFTGEWGSVGTPDSSACQDVDRPGSSDMGQDADNVYGYDSYYLNHSTDSLRTTAAGADNVPGAEFTFCGTGFDLMGRMDRQGPAILVRLMHDGQQDSSSVEPVLVEPASTWSRRGPLVRVRDLEYGTYTVTVEVLPGEDQAGQFGFDGVRVYDPTGTVAVGTSEGDIARAYALDREWSPSYEDLRDELLKVYGNKAFDQAAIVDQNGKTFDPARYDGWGPGNELYLPAGSSIRLTADATYLRNLMGEGHTAGMADMQLGYRLAEGSSAAVTISGSDGEGITFGMMSAAELSFSIRDFYDGTCTITNSGPGVLALTTLKVTLEPDVSTEPEDQRQPEDPEVSEQEGSSETEPPADVPAAPDSIISGLILEVKQSFAAVIIAVADGMEAISEWLQKIARSLFSGGD